MVLLEFDACVLSGKQESRIVNGDIPIAFWMWLNVGKMS
jgi:hypothetical protein